MYTLIININYALHTLLYVCRENLYCYNVIIYYRIENQKLIKKYFWFLQLHDLKIIT